MKIAGLVIATGVVMYLGARRMLQRTEADLRREFHGRIDSLSAAIEKLQRTAAVPTAAPVVSPDSAAVGERQPAAAAQAAEEITPETLVVIAAAVTAFLGKKVRIRSAKVLQTPYEVVNPWAQQGRVLIHASRYLPRGR